MKGFLTNCEQIKNKWRIAMKKLEIIIKPEKLEDLKEVFDECDIGDIFSYEPDRDFQNEPVRKEILE